MLCLFTLYSCESDHAGKKQESDVDQASVYQVDTVTIEGMAFTPQDLILQKGDTVVFVNKDIVPHDATEVNKRWQSPPLQSDASWKIAPTQSADYYCSIHLVMKGKITVK